MFGEFHCSCGRQWSSGYTWIEWDEMKNEWVENWQKCRDCAREVYPTTLQPLRHTGGGPSQKPHDSAACEMCQKHGDCRNYHPSGTEGGDWDDVSVISEASSISGATDDRELSDGTPVNSDEETTDVFLSSQLTKLSMK